MELTKEFVRSCSKINLIKEFLLQAMDQVDANEKRINELEKMLSDAYHTRLEVDADRKKMENRIAELESQLPKWHKVSEGDLPKFNHNVLTIDCYGDYDEMFLTEDYCWYLRDRVAYMDSLKVKCWCERPQPPKEKEI